MSPRFVHGPAPRGWRELVIDKPSPWMLPHLEYFLQDRHNRNLLRARRKGHPLVTSLRKSSRGVDICARCVAEDCPFVTILLTLPRAHFQITLCTDCAIKEWFE